MSDLYWVSCPKCGSKEDLGFACNSPRKNLWVYCCACDIHGPTVPDSAAMDAPTEQDREDSENAAVDAWNEHYGKRKITTEEATDRNPSEHPSGEQRAGEQGA